jgi:phosphatidylglycerophosphatase A
MGTLGALLVAWPLHEWAGFGGGAFGVLSLVALYPAIWAADQTAISSGKKDPQIVVIDEVIGLWVTLAGVAHWNWKGWLGAFALFRLFDIFKPWPIRQFEKLPGGIGIVADDVAAGGLAALVLALAGWFNLY